MPIGERGGRSGRKGATTAADIVAARSTASAADFRLPGAMNDVPLEDPIYAEQYGVWLTDPETGELVRYTYKDLVEQGWMEPGMTPNEIIRAGTEIQALWDESVSGSRGSGRRGSGAMGPIYVKPDERLVRETVRSTLAALAGKVDPQFLDDLTATYMSESQRAFDLRESEQIDPLETVKAKIRETGEYKAIHKLRPDSVDEFDWISSRTGALKRAGVTDKMAQELGIAQATAGASAQEAVTAGNYATFSQSGKLLDELKERISTSTYSALRLI